MCNPYSMTQNIEAMRPTSKPGRSAPQNRHTPAGDYTDSLLWKRRDTDSHLEGENPLRHSQESAHDCAEPYGVGAQADGVDSNRNGVGSQGVEPAPQNWSR